MPYCQQCGAEFNGDQKFCASCGADLAGHTHAAPGAAGVSNFAEVPPTDSTQSIPNTEISVDNHMAKAVLVTIFCCLPLGIASIISAAEVNGKLKAGDITGAQISSKKADDFANWSFGLGLAFGIIYFLITLASGDF